MVSPENIHVTLYIPSRLYLGIYIVYTYPYNNEIKAVNLSPGVANIATFLHGFCLKLLPWLHLMMNL